ncbi:MAG: hypothetical protein ACLT98_16100 [Eggerthellaceae bacterium]
MVPSFRPVGGTLRNRPTEGSTGGAASSRAEFVMREYGMPDGVALAMSSLALAVRRCGHVLPQAEDDFAFLRKALDEGISAADPRCSGQRPYGRVEIVPVDGDDALREELAAVEAAMTPEDYVRVADEDTRCAACRRSPTRPKLWRAAAPSVAT